MAKIFLSYRRDDAAYATSIVQEKLAEHFGSESVFLDVDNIRIGDDFRERLREAVSQCDVLLAMISDKWLDAAYEAGPKKGTRRLDDPGDFVRIEIEAALQRRIPVVPVLLGKALMPAEEDLPGSFAVLAYRQAAEVRPGKDFRAHIHRLIEDLEKLLQRRGAEPVPSRERLEPAPDDGDIELDPMLEEHPAEAVPTPGPTRAVPAQKVVSNGIGMELVVIPAGRFAMGSPTSDKHSYPDEKPQHRVEITIPFQLGVYPVTQEEYQLVTGANPSFCKGPRRPVECVSWFDAVRFCNLLSQREGLDAYYRIDEEQVSAAGGRGYRLPTEAEREYACRAGTQTKWSFGDDPERLDEYAWYRGNAQSETFTVGEKAPNPWGLFDMHGHVWNWCWDWYAGDYYGQSPEKDPCGPEAGDGRVLRGGSFGDAMASARSAARFSNDASIADCFISFRLARSAERD
ncbi:MAG TPA: SUMF1/EgtB/PvdO family nonheme iron enzyme [Thermoguttaceae bacterium]|nr:SUMF1/EgtB/PvdO family nonheme iron enzyme [Thermoguttaceae bacterium]